MNNLIETAKKTLRIEIEALEKMADRLDKSFLEAVDLILNTKEKLIITGVGKSGLVGAKMAATFASTGTSSFFLHPTEALHGDLGMIGKGDTLLAISSSGESEELTKILPHIKRFDIPLIGMTGNKNSSLGCYADVWLNIAVEKEACPLNTAPTASTTLTMALGDALAVALMKKRDFKQEDFASFHPGGSLGKKLFIKIKDLMRTENLPIINEKTPLKEAIVIMNEGKLGNILIVDKEKRLSAILSDGDLRRALTKENFSIDEPVYSYATKAPKSYHNTELLASEALEIIEDARIQLLPITDTNNHIMGVLHIHDLVAAGIKRK
ncbi:MAG: KpsF/GutQ family sugar-phosphate isomerase [Sulfurovum sp.]|nr:KpsF/GutQ family sugar-phosphate isomerase [Sulfurovum sp.]MCB4744086.1 KpsF/GutQ family sugar-phosphate isomerase [Sulfurovum sp.]MCB4746767.1 KpsF/GutQ family sugar-phosphate isomerase [Sulfurovum sp.]MCB4748863.1 KpsF/GutQ family sugar-phosphate isomerase [Sulfurovum sp.]MCB4749956.1 KpsF/GutQ family sugar-phosphate isomerase [Sulfurovum sp.]